MVSEDGQVVKAHKVLLSATSPVLDAILKSSRNDANTNVITK